MYLVDNYIPVYLKKKAIDLSIFLFERVHGEASLKIGWMVKKYNFSFPTALKWSKCILMVSLYI